METLIIRGYPGIGKSYVGKRYDCIVDLESSDYKWIYDKVINMNKELRKSTPYKHLNSDYPNNYIKKIKSLIGKVKVILIAPDEDIRINNFDNRIEELMNQKHSLIILKSNEYLEDYLKEKGIIGD